ncbi:hypothetical protein B4113_0583 [Geobacillus sp. B4113_201601]|nr:hypothetical protein B4113_0583 [Geobacillus sp. B4113_201601]
MVPKRLANAPLLARTERKWRGKTDGPSAFSPALLVRLTAGLRDEAR